MKYRVRNWSAYDRAFMQRGDVAFWLAQEAITGWRPKQTGRRGAQLLFSEVAIETERTLRLVFNLPLRQTGGFLRSIRASRHDLLHILFELSTPAFHAYCAPPSSLRPRRRQHAGMSTERRLRIYDHRLVRLVQETGDARFATGKRAPRSTVAGC